MADEREDLIELHQVNAELVRMLPGSEGKQFSLLCKKEE